MLAIFLNPKPLYIVFPVNPSNFTPCGDPLVDKYCQTPVQSLKSRLGVDFVFPLSQEEQKEEQEQPHQNIAEESILEVLNLTHRLIPSPVHPSPKDINPIRLWGGGPMCFCLLLKKDC